jgi:competence protein ComEC
VGATGLTLLLLLAHAGGIVWADRGGSAAAALGGLALVALVVGARCVAGRRTARRRELGGDAREGWGLLLGLGALAFLLGHHALSRELSRARSDAERAAGLDPKRIRLVDARVAARRATPFGEEIELVDVRSRAGEERIPERVVLALAPGPSRGDRLLWPGAQVRVGLYVSPLRPPRNPGSPDRAHAIARRGFAARARLVKPDWVVERIGSDALAASLSMRLARLRRDAAERVRIRLERAGRDGEPVAGAGLVRALALGDRRALPDETRRAFRALGLAHLISVSGLHIGFVALPAAWAVARMRTRVRPRARPVLGFACPFVAGCIAASCYAWLAGAGVPALRASLLFALFGIVRAAGGKLAPAPALAGIALVLLLADPANLFDLGALFSFTACAALIAGGAWGEGRSAGDPARSPNPPPLRTSRRRRQDLLFDPLRASLAISIGMLPLVELAGLPRALPGPLVNAVAIPWTGLVVMPCALAATALAWGLPEHVGAGGLLLLLQPAAWLEAAAGGVAGAVPASWIGEDRPGRWPWSGAILLGGFAILRLRAGDWASGAAAWIALALFGLAPAPGPGFVDPRPRVVFLDVGQADAALVEAEAATWLIDSGSGPEEGSGGTTVLRALRAQGVERLDVLAITHGDLDHRGGALRILSAVEVGELWLPAGAAEDPALGALAAHARAREVAVRWVSAGDRVGTLDSIRVEVLWPPAPRAGEGGDLRLKAGRALAPRAEEALIWRGPRRNEASLVLRIELAGQAFLFAADVGAETERRLLERGAPLRAEVLKVAHHGSRSSSSVAFVAAVSPRIAVVSAPCGAGRGLPSEPALARLAAAGAELAWTGRDGAVAVSVGSEIADVQAESEGAVPLRMRYWGDERRCVPDRPRADPRREDG